MAKHGVLFGYESYFRIGWNNFRFYCWNRKLDFLCLGADIFIVDFTWLYYELLARWSYLMSNFQLLYPIPSYLCYTCIAVNSMSSIFPRDVQYLRDIILILILEKRLWLYIAAHTVILVFWRLVSFLIMVGEACAKTKVRHSLKTSGIWI